LTKTFLKDILLKIITEIACKVKNQPLVWSNPSDIKSAG
jgi:hypothetical protein